jgi:thiol-disulfide isomerase/thioredoxin
MEKMIAKKMKQMKGMFTTKNLPRLIILVIVLIVLFFVYDKFLKGFEGFETDSLDIEEQVKSGKKLVLFYADWCGHCKKIKPIWDETAKEVNADEVKMIKVNCGEGTDKDQAIMKKYSIDGYPTIIQFINGKPQLYQGERDPVSFKEVFNS